MVVLSPFSRPNPYTGKAYRQSVPLALEQGINAKAIVSAAQSVLPEELVERVEAKADAAGALGSDADGLPAAIIFTDKEKSSPLAKALALHFMGRMRVVEVHKDNALAAEMGVTASPAVYASPAGAATDARVKYDGRLKAPQMIDFLEQYAAARPEASGDDAAETTAGIDGAADDKLQKLLKVGAKVPSLIKEGSARQLMLVAALRDTSEACAAQAQRWMDASAATDEKVQLHVFDASDEAVAAMYAELHEDGEAPPPHAESECLRVSLALDGELEEYEGEISKKALLRAASQRVPDELVPVIDPAMLMHWLHAVPADQPAIVMFSARYELSSNARLLGARMLGLASVAQMDVSGPQGEQMLADFKAAAGPAIKLGGFAVIGMGDEASGGGLTLNPYVGPSKFAYLASWSHQYSLNFKQLHSNLKSEEQDDDDAAETPGVVDASDGVEGKVTAVTSNEELRAACPGSVCVLALLDPEAPTYADHSAELAAVARVMAPALFHVLEVDGSRQEAFAAALGASAEELPAVVVIAPGKGSARMRGSFGRQNIKAAAEDVARGRGVDGDGALPPLVSGGTARFAQRDAEIAAATAAAEEEMSLEDLMGEDFSARAESAEAADESQEGGKKRKRRRKKAAPKSEL